MSKKTPPTFQGPTIFSYGFRPFFLSASIFALIVIPLWMAIQAGMITLDSVFKPTVWHIHEMLFGYAAAVIAGFLFTAIPNWTGRMPVRGWPLAMMVSLWFLGRISVAGPLNLGAPLVLIADCAFLASIVLMITREIVAGKNWRNLKVLLPVVTLFLANIVFHFEAMETGLAENSTRLGFGAIIFLVMLIGGRVIPAFTRNWLVKQGPGALPIPFSKYDAISILVGALALGGWVLFPNSPIIGSLLIVVAGMHVFRLSRWQGLRTFPSPLLLMLHIAYAFVPAGILLLGLDSVSDRFDTYITGLHLLGIGAIGGITVAVMMRATLGHTGRALVAPKILTFAFALIIFASLFRSFLDNIEIAGYNGIEIAATLWTIGFAIFVVKVGSWLATPREQKRKANPAQR
ncbi:MAG: NnrS family protein [Rhodobacteraceae bacterium]|nr:NnrS family protein [Paracoccaceae bacterium]